MATRARAPPAGVCLRPAQRARRRPPRRSLAGAPPRAEHTPSEGQRSPRAAEPRWEAFLASLRAKGFLDGAAAGSAEERRRLDLARARFDQRTRAAPPAHPPAALPSSQPARPAEPAALAADRADALECGAELLSRWAPAHGAGPPDAPPPLSAEAAAGLRAAVGALDRALGGGEAALAPRERARALLLRASAHLELAQLPAARADAASACAAAPHGSALWLRSHVRLGQVLERAGDARRAVAEGYAPALELDPANEVVRRYHDAAVRRANARAAAAPGAPAAGGAAELGGLMSDPEVVQLANSMASQLLADPAMLAQVAALFPEEGGGGGGYGAVDPIQLAALAARLDAAAEQRETGARAADGPS